MMEVPIKREKGNKGASLKVPSMMMMLFGCALVSSGFSVVWSFDRGHGRKISVQPEYHPCLFETKTFPSHPNPNALHPITAATASAAAIDDCAFLSTPLRPSSLLLTF